MPVGWWAARPRATPAQTPGARLGGICRRIRGALQRLVCGRRLPEAAHSTVDALPRAQDLPRRDRRTRDGDAAGHDTLAGEPAARATRGEPADARAGAGVVGGDLEREAGLG